MDINKLNKGIALNNQILVLKRIKYALNEEGNPDWESIVKDLSSLLLRPDIRRDLTCTINSVISHKLEQLQVELIEL